MDCTQQVCACSTSSCAPCSGFRSTPGSLLSLQSVLFCILPPSTRRFPEVSNASYSFWLTGPAMAGFSFTVGTNSLSFLQSTWLPLSSTALTNYLISQSFGAPFFIYLPQVLLLAYPSVSQDGNLHELLYAGQTVQFSSAQFILF